MNRWFTVVGQITVAFSKRFALRRAFLGRREACGKNLFQQLYQADRFYAAALQNILLSYFQKVCFIVRVPPRQEGRIAIVTTRGVGCGGRDVSQRVLMRGRTAWRGREIVWSWHPGADAKLAMFMTSIADDGGKRAGPRGDHV